MHAKTMSVWPLFGERCRRYDTRAGNQPLPRIRDSLRASYCRDPVYPSLNAAPEIPLRVAEVLHVRSQESARFTQGNASGLHVE